MTGFKNAVMYRRALTIALAVALLAVPGTLGCGLFATRDPENPVNAGSGYEPATSPSIVLRNLESALSYANAGDYRKCFADTARGMFPFTFHASAEGVAVAPAQFANWGIDKEEEYVRNVFAELREGLRASVVFTPPDVTTVPIGDSLRFSADYVVRFPHSRLGAEEEGSGTLVLTFRQSRQNEWYITHWSDVSRSDKPSWSLIKARFIDR